MKHTHHYIYKITRLDGKFYIGRHSTNNLSDGYFGSGQMLHDSIKKHGKQAHTIEIIEFCDSREYLILREGQIVTLDLVKDPQCMNLVIGGKGGTDDAYIGKSNRIWITNDVIQMHHPKDKPIPDGFRRGVCKSTTTKIATANTGKARSESAKHKTAEKHRGMKRSESAKAKMSAKARARTTKAGDAHPNFGRHWWTDGAQNLLKAECPGGGWIKGRALK